MKRRAAVTAAALAAALFLYAPAATAAAGDLVTVGGGVGTGTATSIAMNPRGLAVTADSLYIADPRNSVIREVDLVSGAATVVAGTSVLGFAGDGGQATSASLNAPLDVDVDGSGNLYIADTTGNRIRKVATNGVISTLAGTGTSASTGDGAQATAAAVQAPPGLAVDASGNVFFTETTGGKIRKITTATGVISTFATVTSPRGIDTDAAGDVYVTTTHAVLKIPAAGGASVPFAGTGAAGSAGNGGAATIATLNNPYTLCVDNAGNVYISELSGNRVRLVTAATGIISLFAGTGTAGTQGDGGVPTAARIYNPFEPVIAPDGAVYFGQFVSAGTLSPNNSQVRKVQGNVISTFAGNGWFGFSGDGGQLADAQFDRPAGMARDPAGNLYIADSFNNRVRKVALDGVVTTVAGTGVACLSACTTPASVRDGQLATTAYLYRPTNVAVDAAGNLYISDTSQHRIRMVDASTGLISTIAGTGTGGYVSDGVAAATARLSGPQGIWIATGGVVTFADTANRRIRQFTVGGDISTIAGIGTSGATDGAATSVAQFVTPVDVQFGPDGTLYIADSSHRVRKLSGGVVSTVTGTGTAGDTQDGGTATGARLNAPASLTVDTLGNLYVAEVGATSGVIRRIDRNNVISTVAGVANSAGGFTGNGVATATRLFSPGGLVFDPSGNLYITEQGAQRIRMIRLATAIATWWISSNLQSAANVQYAYDMTTATAGTLGSIAVTVPAATGGTPTLTAVYGAPAGGTVSRVGTTITYTFPAPASVPVGVHIYLRFGGLTNATAGTYAGSVTTVSDLGAAVDQAGTSTVTLATANTGYSPATPRTATLNQPADILVAMSPATTAMADRTVATSWPIVSTAPRGYTLTVQSSGFTGTEGTLTPISPGVATAVVTGSVPVNRFGYGVTMSGSGVVTASLVNRWAGFAASPEQIVSTTVAAPADTITLNTRGKIDYLTKAGTYSGTVTYTLTPSY